MSEGEQIELLTGQGVGELLSRALGPSVDILSWRVDTVHHRPSAGVSVGYELNVSTPDGERSTQSVCTTTATLTRGSPSLVHLEHADGLGVHVWQHPHDPELPMLARALDSARMSDAVGQAVTSKLVAYRPTRRAVARLEGSDGRPVAFAKIVRPSVARAITGRHQILVGSGTPVPPVLHTASNGLLVLGMAGGVTMANYIAAGLPDPIATFDAVMGALDSLPEAVLDLPVHPAWADRVEHYGHAAATALPERAREAHALAAQVRQQMSTSKPGPIVPTHGDFYEANIFMSGTEHVSEILDVDSVGPGRRVDDIACLLGHLSVLPHLAPAVYPHVPALVELWWEHAARNHDPRALAARAAAVTLSLVAGAKRQNGAWRTDAEGRLREVNVWLARA